MVVEAATKECESLLETITSSTAEVETKQEKAVKKEEDLKVRVWGLRFAFEPQNPKGLGFGIRDSRCRTVL